MLFGPSLQRCNLQHAGPSPSFCGYLGQKCCRSVQLCASLCGLLGAITLNYSQRYASNCVAHHGAHYFGTTVPVLLAAQMTCEQSVSWTSVCLRPRSQYCVQCSLQCDSARLQFLVFALIESARLSMALIGILNEHLESRHTSTQAIFLQL